MGGCNSSKDADPKATPVTDTDPKMSQAKGTGINCYDASPEVYTVVAEFPSAKLVKMAMKAGGADEPHDHPVHHMYVFKGGKLKISMEGGSDVKEIPSGAAIIMPAGPHQVSNVGENDVEFYFIEPTGKLGVTPDNHVTPFETNPNEYKVLAEDDDWVLGQMTMQPGQTDNPHSHRDHFILVVEGDELTIYPGTEKDEKTKMVIPIKSGATLPAPQGHHIVTNSGKTPCKLVFWEPKKGASSSGQTDKKE